MPTVARPFYFVIWLGLAIFQLAAFMEGLDVWLGLNTYWSVLAFVLAVMTPLLGSIFVAAIGFVGATEGWRWEWWQAALLCGLFVIMSFEVMGVGGAIGALSQFWLRTNDKGKPVRFARTYDVSSISVGGGGRRGPRRNL